jgi:peptide/nickel transport system substrate-binding protein
MLKKGRIAFASTFLMLVAALVAACGTTTTTSPPGPTTGYHYTTPKTKGGTLLISDWQFPTSTNGFFTSASVTLEVANGLWASPVMMTSDGNIIPDQLAEIPTQKNGDVSADGLTVTMKLNPNLKWSDGQPITADDFKFWIEATLDPTSGAASQVGFTPDTLASYSAADSHTLVLKYVKPFAPYIWSLPNAFPRHAWGTIPFKDWLNTPSINLSPKITSGPFFVQDYSSGQSITLVPNPYYTSTTFHPTVLDKLIFKGYQSKDALIAGYQAGETDSAQDFTLGDLDKLNSLPGLQVTPGWIIEQVSFNLTNPVLQDVNVRKAFNQAFDRCTFIVSVLHNDCSKLSSDTIEPAPHPDANTAVKEFPFDLTAAKNDMKAAGWDCSSGTCMKGGAAFPTLNMATTSGNTLRKNFTELFKQALAKLGVTINLDGQYYPAGTLFDTFSGGGTLATGKYDLALFAYVLAPDSDGNLYTSLHSSQIPTAANPAGGNWGRVNDPQLDQLLEQGRTTLDIAKRKQIYGQVQALIAQKVYLIPMYIRANITLTDNKVGNFFPNPASFGNQWNIADYYLKTSTT